MTGLAPISMRVLVAGWLAVVATPVGAQAPRPLDVADDLHADATFTDVYVNDSFAASDAVARAEGLARRGDWEEAAELLQKTSDEGGGKLIRLSPGYYVGIRDHINGIIAAWPDAGLKAYRFLFERRLVTGLNELGARPPMHRLHTLLDRYFCTEGAVELSEKIAQASIESGDFAAAELVCQRIVDRHPSGRRLESRFRALLAVLAAIGGREGDATGGEPLSLRWMGSDRPLGEITKQVSEGFTIARKAPAPRSWPIFAGVSERNRRSSTTVDELGLLWRTRVDRSSARRSGSTDEGADPERGLDRAELLSSQPVAEGGLVFVQRFREIVALRVGTGAIVWRFRADSSRAADINFADDQPSGWDAVTVFDGRVYASLPGETLPFYSYESARSPSELVCLDAKTGRVIWRLDQQVIEEDFAEVMFDSSPLVRQGRMFVVGRRRRSFGFEDCYLYCFDSGSGRPLFRTHLGSASTGTFGSRRATRAIAAMHSDSVYVCSNLGTVASVSGTTGSVQWLRLYARARNKAGGSSGGRRPWHYNPIVWSDDRLLVLPLDAHGLLVLRATDGRLRHEVAGASMGNIETIFGVHGHILCGSGDEVGCYDLMSDEMVWSAPLPDGMTPRGRGVWADDRLLVPTRRGLSVFSVHGGEHTFMRWDTEGRAGNVLALANELIVVDGYGVSAYVRLSDILSALRERMRVAPSDPAVALELAEVSLSNGEYADALSVLEEAVKRAELLGERLEPLVRQRLFDDAIMFSRRLAARNRLEPAALNALFGYASRFTPGAAANVTYRFRFAELFEQQGDPARAVVLYQQILRDRLLRELGIDDAGTATEPAGAAARYRIGALIEQHGRAIYAPHEVDANAWLDRGIQSGDGAALERVVESFPNSEAAARALIAHGDLLVGTNQGERAAHRYAKALHDYGKRVDRPALLRKIADAYESADMMRQAYRWLGKAAREHPGVRFEHDGRRVTFDEYRRRLDRVRAQVEPSRPRIRLPLDQQFETTFVGEVSLMSPRFADVPRSSWSRYFVRTDEGIRAFDSRSGTAVWPAASPMAGATELLFSGADVVLFSTPHEIVALDVSTGVRRWSHGSPPRGVDDPNADWELGDAFRGFALHGDRLVAVREGGRMVCLAIGSGEKLWTGLPPIPCRRLWYRSDARVVCHGLVDDHAVLQILDADSGGLVSTIHTEDHRAFESVFPTIDGQVVVVGSESIASFEPDSGALRWRYPLHGRAYVASLLVDVDTLYLSDNGRTIKSLNLESGTLLWESERLVTRRHEDLTVALAGSSLIVSSSSSASGVDAVTGLTLWQGTTPEDPRFVARFLTDAYLVAVDVPEEDQRESVAYFYDHRNASGLIPRDGGTATLGRLPDLKAVIATDGGLIVQTGSTIRGWVHR